MSITGTGLGGPTPIRAAALSFRPPGGQGNCQGYDDGGQVGVPARPVICFLQAPVAMSFNCNNALHGVQEMRGRVHNDSKGNHH